MGKPPWTLIAWLDAHEPEARIIFTEAVIALGNASEAWALISTRSHASTAEDLRKAYDAEIQISSLLAKDVARLRTLTRELIRVLESGAGEDVDLDDAPRSQPAQSRGARARRAAALSETESRG